jgi:hypothetical protein
VLIGLDGYCAVRGEDVSAKQLRRLLAERLLRLLVDVQTENWVWFEEGLSYDNARLPQALILTGLSSGSSAYIGAGIRTLRWLMAKQTAPGGHFRPIGTEGFGNRRASLEKFDQQPVEAAATISACMVAWPADQGAKWKAGAASAFDWFLGANDLSQSVVDIDTGSCPDGLHRLRVNENRGGESVVSYLLGLVEPAGFPALAISLLSRVHHHAGFQPDVPKAGLPVAIWPPANVFLR